MSELKTPPEGIVVHLVRAGVAVRDYHLSTGATLADLLRLSEASTTNQSVFVDGVSPEETLTLRDGAIVAIVPQPRRIAGDEPWRATIPSFEDEVIFKKMLIY